MKFYFNVLKNKMLLICTLIIFNTNNQSFSKIFEVGPSRFYKTPSSVSGLVNDGDTVDIDAGLYKGDVCSWYKNNLLFRGIDGFAHLSADGKSSEQKAIWVIKGQNCTVEFIEFSDCKVADNNGAGIRVEGDNLNVNHCYFHDNEDGLLSGASKTSTIIIEFSEFARNGHGDGLSHNMYIGGIKKFVLRFCYIHNAIIGHNVKSRASENIIAYNLIIDSTFGNASYQIDLPNGGLSYIIGNSIMKGKNADNSCLLSFGMEGIPQTNPANLFIYNNTIINERAIGRVLQFNDNRVTATVFNNMFVNMQYFCDKPCDTLSNIFIDNIDGCKFKEKNSYDYHLTDVSPGIDQGSDISQIIPESYYIPVEYEYKHPKDSTTRKLDKKMDIGAFEYFSLSDVAQYNSNNSLEYEIFPNPATDYIEINLNTINPTLKGGVDEGSDIKIFDILGVNVSTAGGGIIGGGRIDISNLSPGIYYIKIGNHVAKFVKM
jgi:hypothetical protein